MQPGDTDDLDGFATLYWTSTMEIDVSIVGVYRFMTDTTHIRGNFSLKRLSACGPPFCFRTFFTVGRVEPKVQVSLIKVM